MEAICKIGRSIQPKAEAREGRAQRELSESLAGGAGRERRGENFSQRRPLVLNSNKILRASPSGSSTIRHLLSKTIVAHFAIERRPRQSALVGIPRARESGPRRCHLFRRACAFVSPSSAGNASKLSKQNANSAVCHAPASPSIGDCHVKNNTRKPAHLSGRDFISPFAGDPSAFAIRHAMKARPEYLLRMRLLHGRNQRRRLGIADNFLANSSYCSVGDDMLLLAHRTDLASHISFEMSEPLR